MSKRLETVTLRRDLSGTAIGKAMKIIDRGYVESWQLCDIANEVWLAIMRYRAMRSAPATQQPTKRAAGE